MHVGESTLTKQSISQRALAGMRSEPTVAPDSARWNLIRTEPRRYDIAQQSLEAEGFTIYVPKIKTFVKTPLNKLSHAQRRKGYFARGTWEPRPWLPGYVFSKDEGWPVAARDLHKLTGVLGPVYFGEEIASLSRAAVSEIRKREAEETLDVHSFAVPFGFSVGEEVRIADGPFVGFNASVEKVEDAEILNLLANIFGRKTRLQLHVDQVEKL
jgi:transcription antitermination factor NusG